MVKLYHRGIVEEEFEPSSCAQCDNRPWVKEPCKHVNTKVHISNNVRCKSCADCKKLLDYIDLNKPTPKTALPEKILSWNPKTHPFNEFFTLIREYIELGHCPFCYILQYLKRWFWKIKLKWYKLKHIGGKR